MQQQKKNFVQQSTQSSFFATFVIVFLAIEKATETFPLPEKFINSLMRKIGLSM